MEYEITEVRDGTIIATEINTIKNRTKREVLIASIEIGQRLCEVKEIVPFGEWEQWLHDKVDYSQSTANNLMKIYKEYGDDQINLLGASKSQTFGNLSYSQAVALFALPAEEREDFVKDNDAENMTARQLQEAIKAKEAAESEKTVAENKLQGTEKLLEKTKDDKDRLEQALKKSDDEKTEAEKRADDEIKELREQLAKAAEPAAPSPKEIKKLRDEIRQKIESDFNKKEQQLTLEKKSAEDKTAEIEKNYQEQLKRMELDNESILRRQQEAERKLALSAPEAHQCNAYLTSIQQNFNNIKSVIDLLQKGNPEIAGKLRQGIQNVLVSLAEQLKAEGT